MSATPATLDLVVFGLGGWRLAVEACWVAASSPRLPDDDTRASLALLGLSGVDGAARAAIPSGQASRRDAGRRLHLRQHSGAPGGDAALVVDGPVELLTQPLATLFPVPELLRARCALRGLRALVVTPEAPDATPCLPVLDPRHWWG